MSIPAFDRTKDFDLDRFASPPAIDRGAPFWSWNGKLDRDRLLHQLDVFGAMGLGGGHMHPRTGLATPYMSDEFLGLVRAVTDRAAESDMHAWLYDEDRWPSGFAGGLATAEEAHRTRHLRLTRRAVAEGESLPCPTHHGAPLPLDRRSFVAAWALTFSNGKLVSRRRVAQDESCGDGESPLYAYLEVPPPWTWFNNTQYVDTLNPRAMRRFIDETHEKYKEAVGDRFGSVIPAIFTDEPLFRGMDIPASPSDERDLFLSWTDDLPQTYREAYDEDLLDVLPDVLFERADHRHRLARWRFHNHHTNRFVNAFAAQVGAWCEKNRIALTGHMMAESTLGSQTQWVGEAMRSLHHFGLPGIDMLCDQLELSTAKQAQSVARQKGAPGILSELYGVTNWDFPFAGHKRQGDWQAALGVVTRVHHLTWYQMSGEAKRDYPASIGEHAPWWRRYSVMEDHFARVNAALRSGTPRCRVAMIHPIESYWLVHGPSAAVYERRRLEDGFAGTLRWLLESQIDVDFVSESLLAEEPARDIDPETAPTFRVGEMAYETVVVPPVITLRKSTLDRLRSFALAGGRVIMLDGGPSLIDAEQTATSSDLDGFSQLGWQQSALVEALEPVRDLRLLTADGLPARGCVHQARDLPDGGRILFVCRCDDDPNYHLDGASLQIRGSWDVHELDTASGRELERPACVSGEWTEIPVDLPIAGHVLLHLAPGSPAKSVQPAEQRVELGRLPDPYSIELHEENVLLLDRGEWRLDDGEWQPATEVLRIDNEARSQLGLPPRSGNIAQPWTEPPRPHDHRVTIRYTLRVAHDTRPVRLALEDASNASIVLDQQPITITEPGEWMDIAFTTASLPPLAAGDHVLEIDWGFGGSGGLEACFLLGSFGVSVSGSRSIITKPVEALTWGDATRQGLAFYGGTIRYTVRVDLPKGSNRELVIPHFNGALVDVTWPGEEPAAIYRAPWSTPVPDRLHGETEVTIDCYGTRINTFGQVHNVAKQYRWWGPASWRTEGNDWADEYQLKPTGVLVAPRVVSR